MIDKYYNGVIEQVYNHVGTTEKNIVMANYNNDFSIKNLETVKRYRAQMDSVFFASREFGYRELTGAYEPFLDTICDMFRAYGTGDFDAFLDGCGVYELHKEILRSYYESGICKRNENVLLNEVAYEQNRMTEAMTAMLKALAKEHPLMLVINRFQMASRSTFELVHDLIAHPDKNIGLVLGVNDSVGRKESVADVWDRIVESLKDRSQLYHIGSSDHRRTEIAREHVLGEGYTDNVDVDEDYEASIQKVSNIVEFLDYDQAKRYFREVEYQIKFEDARMKNASRRAFYLLYAKTSILLGELSKALELLTEAKNLIPAEYEFKYRAELDFLRGTCYMYQGKLDRAERYADQSYTWGVESGDERAVFRAELLKVMAQMSGWYNIFFCVKDIPIEPELIEKLIQYDYQNHLAHIYIYAYDNQPNVVAKAYRSEAALFYFSKGVTLAKKIGNEQLVYDAYQKNIMLASTNGMNEIALLYSVRTYEFVTKDRIFYEGRMFSGIGYNLSAMGKNELAEQYYNHSIQIFYQLGRSEDIAEVYYNRSLNYMMQEQFKEAEHDLLFVMKVIEKLHLNSLRVCNLSKLYALLALIGIMQKDRFTCERYLLSCRQFLNYIIEKEKNNKNEEIIHDYAKCDDDMFLYTFSQALLKQYDGDLEQAYNYFMNAEKFLARTGGNEFFSYRIFRKARMELFDQMGRKALYEQEKELLAQHDAMSSEMTASLSMDILQGIQPDAGNRKKVASEEEIEALVKHEGLLRDFQTNKRQMEFFASWQKMIDITDQKIPVMVQNAISSFINHFNLDCALYIYYQEGRPNVLYNDSGCSMTAEVLLGIRRAIKEYPQGFAASKIGEGFFEHQDMIAYFGEDDVCSFVAVPFMKNGTLTSLLITYVRMKDNWHGSIERYMLNEDDLYIYRLLFREMEYSINRLEAYEKASEMNKRLQAAAETDMLTGVYNRAGMYEQIAQIEEHLKDSPQGFDVGLMFIDLDNFKHYNDTFGHDIGDLILKEMAAIFKDVSVGKGFVSRYGGDEFIIILETDDRRELEAIAKEIYARINATSGFKKQIEEHLGHAITVNEGRLITCSMGIAYASDVRHGDEVSSLIKQADDLLYIVKTGEKGHYKFL